MPGEIFVEVTVGQEAFEPQVTPATLTQAQAFEIEQNRVAARRASAAGAPGREPEDTVGLALSGGGIRSATFSLGIIRALGRLNLIRQIDYLSTVSGGSYIGAFLGSRFIPQVMRGDLVQDAGTGFVGGSGDPLEGPLGDKAFEHLRQSGRHLLPGNGGDVFRVAVMLIRNWIAIQTVLGCTLLAFYLFFKPIQAFWMLWPAWQVAEGRWAAGGLSPWFWPSAWLAGFPLGHWLIASPLIPVSVALFLVTIALNWAYFHARANPHMPTGRVRRVLLGPSFGVVVFATLVGLCLIFASEWLWFKKWLWFTQFGAGLQSARGLGVVLTFLALLSLIAYAAAAVLDWSGYTIPGQSVAEMPLAQEDRVRARLTTWAGSALGAATTFLVLGILDTIAQTIYSRSGELWVPLSLGTIAAVAIPVLRQLIMNLPKLATGKGKIAAFVRRFGRILALIAGLTLLSLIALIWAVVAHFIAWRGGPIGSMEMWVAADTSALSTPLRAAVVLALLTAVFIGIAYLIGRSFGFINLSTYSQFYSTRLRRAYLGASNTDRYSKPDDDGQPMDPDDGNDDIGIDGNPKLDEVRPTDSDAGNDDIGIDRYYDPRVRGPVHLINITVNDTASGSSSTVQRDRRGKPLVLSPAGFLFPRASARERIVGIAFPDRTNHDAVRAGPDLLPLSVWVGLSGAAASTGLGQYGSLGLSLLTGLSNVRLGQWWDAGENAETFSRMPRKKWLWRKLEDLVQARFKDELLGQFPGTDGRRWYLTDGGHFENTGVYELVRRRVGFIIACDNGADPKYEFGDLVILTRRIKIDFDAELSFFSEAELDHWLGPQTKIRQAFGNLEALAVERKGDPRLGPYAALGRIRYERPPKEGDGVPNRRESTLLLIKPRICGTEATDLAAYAKANPPFPQQSTLDQFYDEAQWESYYRLGLVIGEHVFGAMDGDRWSAGRLQAFVGPAP